MSRDSIPKDSASIAYRFFQKQNQLKLVTDLNTKELEPFVSRTDFFLRWVSFLFGESGKATNISFLHVNRPSGVVILGGYQFSYFAFNSQQSNGMPSFPCESEKVQFSCELLIESDYLIGSLWIGQTK